LYRKIKMAKQTKAYLALLFICITWGTTYLAIRVGVLHYPAFLFAGVRQFTAGLILMTIAIRLNKKTDFSRKNIFRQMLIGLLMLTVGNGFVTWGEKYVPSGISALICSMMPIFAVLFNLASSKRDHFNLPIAIGMLLGICGVGLIFKNDIASLTNKAYLSGIAAILIATASWALGSIINKKNIAPINAVLNSGMQLFFGGLFLLLSSPVVDSYAGFHLWYADSFFALCYLIVFGSVLAYAAYMFALSKLPIGISTIYAYINPLVAVILGYLVLSEPLNINTAFAFITIVAGVYLVNIGYRKQHQSTIIQGEQTDKLLTNNIE
jgi:drug/metabolite transporter (DMT)-like permease